MGSATLTMPRTALQVFLRLASDIVSLVLAASTLVVRVAILAFSALMLFFSVSIRRLRSSALSAVKAMLASAPAVEKSRAGRAAPKMSNSCLLRNLLAGLVFGPCQ